MSGRLEHAICTALDLNCNAIPVSDSCRQPSNKAAERLLMPVVQYPPKPCAPPELGEEDLNLTANMMMAKCFCVAPTL